MFEWLHCNADAREIRCKAWLVRLPSGQTLGKRVLGLRVADATTGAVPDLDQALRRSVPTLLQQVPVVSAVAWLLYAPVLWSPRRQGYHDRFAGTVVLDERGDER